MTIQVVSSTESPREAPPAEKVEKVEEPSAPESKDSEQKESTESDPGEDDAKEPNEDPDAEDSEDEIEAKGSDDEKPRKKGGFQRRIDKLNSRVTERERELEYWKAQALKGAGEPKTESKVETKPDQTTASGEPNPDDFDTHAEFVRAVTRWEIKQENKASEDRANKTKLEVEQAAILKTHSERVKAFTEKNDDFAERMESLDGIPVSLTLQELIVSSENGPELMYELGKSREEFARICKLSPLDAAREMGKIEARLSSGASAEKKSEPKKLTSAPRPLDPVGKGASTARKSLSDPNLSQSEYERIRRDQMKRAEA